MSVSNQLDSAISSNAVLESSLSRIWQHHGKTGFAILTAWLGQRPGAKDAAELRAMNKKAMAELRADIKASGFGFIPMEGVGQEERDGKIVEAPEPSFLVPNSKPAKHGKADSSANRDELRKLVMRLGKKYDQTAVLIHDPETGSEIIAPSGEVLDKYKSFGPNTVAKFFTRLSKDREGRVDRHGNKGLDRKGRTFTLESLAWWGLRYGDPPGGWLEGMAHDSQGRVRIAECSDRLDEWLAEMGIA